MYDLDTVLSTVRLSAEQMTATREKQQLCLDSELRARLRVAATSRGMTVSGLVSRILEAVLPPLPKSNNDNA